jgi:hypothetical protein
VDCFGNVGVMTLWRLDLKGGITDLVTVVDGASFSPVGPGTDEVLGLLVCSWNSSEDTSVIGGDKSCLGLFSFGTCGVVIGDTVVGGPYCVHFDQCVRLPHCLICKFFHLRPSFMNIWDVLVLHPHL